MDMKDTFKLEELDDKFWGKVIYIEVEHSTGLGGSGGIWLITEEKKLFFIGFETFPYSEYELEKFHSVFKRERCVGVNDRSSIYVVEREDWIYSTKADVLIKEKYFFDFEKIYIETLLKNHCGIHYVDCTCVMGKVLGVEGELERFDEENFAKNNLKNQQECEKSLSNFKNEKESNWLFDENGRRKERIPEMLKQLEIAWKGYPDMRLGQLISNIVRNNDLFSIEDDDFFELMKEYILGKNNRGL